MLSSGHDRVSAVNIPPPTPPHGRMALLAVLSQGCRRGLQGPTHPCCLDSGEGIVIFS